MEKAHDKIYLKQISWLRIFRCWKIWSSGPTRIGWNNFQNLKILNDLLDYCRHNLPWSTNASNFLAKNILGQRLRWACRHVLYNFNLYLMNVLQEIRIRFFTIYSIWLFFQAAFISRSIYTSQRMFYRLQHRSVTQRIVIETADQTILQKNTSEYDQWSCGSIDNEVLDNGH